MGVLYTSSIPSQRNVYHDSFSIIDDRSCASFCANRRSTYFSDTVSGICHSFLLVICCNDYVDSPSHQWQLQRTGDQVKNLGQRRKIEGKKNGLLTPSGKSTIQRRVVNCGAETRKSELSPTIYGSLHSAEVQLLDELAPGDAGAADGKPLPKLTILGDDHPEIQASPGKESINDQGLAENRQKEQKLSAGALEDNIKAAEVPLPPSPPLLPLNDYPKEGKQISPSVAGRLEKRQRDDNHEDGTQNTVCFKRVMSRSQNVTVYVQQPNATTILSAVAAEPRASLSRFEVSRKDRAMDLD